PQVEQGGGASEVAVCEREQVLGGRGLMANGELCVPQRIDEALDPLRCGILVAVFCEDDPYVDIASRSERAPAVTTHRGEHERGDSLSMLAHGALDFTLEEHVHPRRVLAREGHSVDTRGHARHELGSMLMNALLKRGGAGRRHAAEATKSPTL